MVPIDTTGYSDYYRDLIAKGSVNKFCNNYIDENRGQLKKQYPSEDRFIEAFAVTDEMMNQLTAHGEKDGVKLNDEQFAISAPTLRRILKALIGRDLFEQSTYYRIANDGNPVYKEAIEIITDPRAYSKLLGQ